MKDFCIFTAHDMPDLLSHVWRLGVPPAMLLLLVDGKVLSTAAAEKRLVHL